METALIKGMEFNEVWTRLDHKQLLALSDLVLAEGVNMFAKLEDNALSCFLLFGRTPPF